jgi:hypothetical protein
MNINDYLARRATRAFIWRAATVIASAVLSLVAYLLATL